MGTRAVINYLALLKIVADVAVVAGLVLWAGGAFVPSLARARSATAAALAPYALPLAFAVAATATVGSLWLSEGAHFVPCKLCWYQRIAMYPLTPLLGLAAIRNDAHIRFYGAAVALIGLPISGYHYLVERFPSLESGACDPTNPCTILWVWKFHFISIPFMAGSAFALILVLLALVPRSAR